MGVTRQLPFAPRAGARIVHADLPGVPVAHPDPTSRIRPHAPRALPFGRRLDDGRLAGLGVDLRDVVAGE